MVTAADDDGLPIAAGTLEDGGTASHTGPFSDSLFPLPVPSVSVSASTISPPLPPAVASSSWLCNTSFNIDVYAPSTFPSHHQPPSPAASDDDPSPRPPAPLYDLVQSSHSSSDEGRGSWREDRGRREGKGKKKKRRIGRSEEGSSLLKPTKEYYFDLRGDPDNLFYGSLYRMDIPRYKLYNDMELSWANFPFSYPKRSKSCMDTECDNDALDSKLKSGFRYSSKYSAIEHTKVFKHVKILDKKASPTSPEEFIPLIELYHSSESGHNVSHALEELEESWEDELLRTTREFNRMSRNSPHDERVWFSFAEFQDKVASKQPQKAARLQTLEKKIHILEKAVELNPENEELLLCLLKSYHGRDSTDVLIDRWEKILMQHPERCKLWKEYLLFRQGDFSRFKVSDMRSCYAHAIQALSSSCNKLYRKGHHDDQPPFDPALVQLELGLVDVFINLCRFEWQTGHQELATGLFQAEMEYCLFNPSLLLSLQSKKRLFEYFWNSNCARLGDDGALGWSTWLEKEDFDRQKLYREVNPHEVESSGWTGWQNPSSLLVETTGVQEKSADDILDENTDRPVDAEDSDQEDDAETLIKNLGININSEPHDEVKDTSTWKRWSEVELSRDSEQWMPVRKHTGSNRNSELPGSDLEVYGDEQISSFILFEDVSDYLFPLSSKEANISLVVQFIDFYGGKVPQWLSTNSSTWIEKILSLETMPNQIVEGLRGAFELFNGDHEFSTQVNLDSFFGSITDLSKKTNMMKFLKNAILLCLKVIPRNVKLEEALLAAEDFLISQMNSPSHLSNSSGALAKKLLKNDRQDLLLCGIYGRCEAAHGNIDLARKIFDMALSSIEGLPLDIQQNIPLLYFWYAEIEITRSTSDDCSDLFSQRAVHILSCLGGNMSYVPFKCHPSGLQILRARHGYKEHIKKLQSVWAHGDIKENSIALICSAALFEILTTGCPSGFEVIHDAFSMVLPERRNQSFQLELLWIYYIGLILKHGKQLKFTITWDIISHGLRTYPYSPKAFSAMVRVGYLYAVPNTVRRLFDECSRRKPSVILLMFALSYELCNTGSHHRLHGLLESALTDDKLQKSVLLWRCYLAYEADISRNATAARRIFFRAIHACPWSKRLWLDGFQKLSSILSTKELSDLQEVMRDKELNLRTDIYEILLEDEIDI